MLRRYVSAFLRSLLIEPAHSVIWYVGLLSSTTRIEDGIRVSVFAGKAEAAELFERVAQALHLIREHDSRRYERLKMDLARIFVAEGSGAEYVPSIGACHVAINHVRRRSTPELAMTLVHEATHARLWRAGFRYQNHLRERIERLCVTEEIVFVRRLPGSTSLIEKAEKLLETEWWTTHAQVDDALRRLEALGSSRWLLALLRRIATLKREVPTRSDQLQEDRRSNSRPGGD